MYSMEDFGICSRTILSIIISSSSGVTSMRSFRSSSLTIET